MELGQSVDVVLLYDDSQIRSSPDLLRYSTQERPALRQQLYQAMKREVLQQLGGGSRSQLLHDYQRLPLSRVQLHGAAGLSWLRSRGDIVAVFENAPIYPQLSESIALIEQPVTQEAGYAGNGVSVAVVDTGVNYTHAAFGPCTAPGVPESCRVAVSVDIATEDGEMEFQGHGSNVSAIVAGVAPGSRLVVLDIFEGSGSTTALVLEAMDWLLENAATYGIKAVNLCIGDNSSHTVPCADTRTNPFVLAIDDLRESGISVVASSGNSGLSQALGLPACTPGVLSVGAVYDANVGSRSWSVCTDSTTGGDKVACFANSASFLSLLVPGGLITAGGYTMAGTSQASPHVAGAVEVLASGRSDMTPDQISERLVATGDAVINARNGLTFPRLNLFAALTREIEGYDADVPFLPPWALATIFALFSAAAGR